MATPPLNTTETDDLLARAARGDRGCLGILLDRDRDRLRRMIATRLDRRLQGRIDPSDVIQEAQLEAAARLAEYVSNPTMPLFLWLRLITGQRLAILHRRHLGARCRAADREVSLDRLAVPQVTSAALAEHLLVTLNSPSSLAAKAELKALLHEALEALGPLDREVLILRHFEQLSAAETARELDISVEAAKKRHIRALKKLRAVLGADASGGGGSAP